jgi:hypothetical protein
MDEQFKPDSSRLTVRSANNLAFAQAGRTYTSNTTPVVASAQGCDFYGAIVILTDTVFTKLDDLSADGQTELGVTFTAPDIIYGMCTAYTLASGSVRAIKVKNAWNGGED